MSKNRIIAVIGLFFVACIGVVLADSFNRSVEVTDPNGVLRTVMFAANDDNKSGFEVRDNRSNVRFSVHTNANHDPFANFIDANGKNRIELGIAPDGSAYFIMRKGDGTITHKLVAPN